MKANLSTPPDEIRRKFANLRGRRDVADLLEVSDGYLVYLLFVRPEPQRYRAFPIKKRSGGYRQINAPTLELKILQRRLNQVLQLVYNARPPVHGFVPGKSIVTNAQKHAGAKYVLNLDLADFFPSINFRRVRGLFRSPPYSLPLNVASLLARICCHEDQLPQGAPTSPIVSNMICSRMDGQLWALARECDCMYTRYADDITFSTCLSTFPADLARIGADTGAVLPGDRLVEMIVGNGFFFRYEKIRLQAHHQHQEVTGLTTNRKPNVSRTFVRQIRAMLYAWGRFGPDAAGREWRKVDKATRRRGPYLVPYESVVRGKIEFVRMVKGKDDPVYCGLRKKLDAILNASPEKRPDITRVWIATEGSTDWPHLQAALQYFQAGGRYTNLKLEQVPAGKSEGKEALAVFCRSIARVHLSEIVVCVFDSDAHDNKEEKALNEMRAPKDPFRAWGADGKVFSLVLPVPQHRQETHDGVELELYYRDEDLGRFDGDKHRLYLESEFREPGWHQAEDLFWSDFPDKGKDREAKDAKKVGKQSPGVVDKHVWAKERSKAVSVALSKAKFADYVKNRDSGFESVDFSAFAEIFDILGLIVSAAVSFDKTKGLHGSANRVSAAAQSESTAG